MGSFNLTKTEEFANVSTARFGAILQDYEMGGIMLLRVFIL